MVMNVMLTDKVTHLKKKNWNSFIASEQDFIDHN